jgi:hypothetical protein
MNSAKTPIKVIVKTRFLTAADRMYGSIREFGFKIPCLVRGNGEVVDGHLRLKAARKLELTEQPRV